MWDIGGGDFSHTELAQRRPSWDYNGRWGENAISSANVLDTTPQLIDFTRRVVGILYLNWFSKIAGLLVG
jgi:hypothetical protein